MELKGQMKTKRVVILFVLSLCFYTFFAPVLAIAENTNYYLDITLFTEEYAKIEVGVENYGDFYNKGVVIGLPILRCVDSSSGRLNTSGRIRIFDIPPYQTLDGNFFPKNCGGITILRPYEGTSSDKNFAFTFRYDSSDWNLHPEKYPFDTYNMPILINFPNISSNAMDGRGYTLTKIILPPNTIFENISVNRFYEHPLKTNHTPTSLYNTSYTRGNQQIMRLEKGMSYSSNSPPVLIYISLQFKRIFETQFIFIFGILAFSLLLYTISHKIAKTGRDFKADLLTIAIILFSYYQFLSTDKPVGVTTYLDYTFAIFMLWISILVFANLVNISSIRRKLSLKWRIWKTSRRMRSK